MGVYIKENKLVIMTEPMTTHFDLMLTIIWSMKHNEFLGKNTIKIEINRLLPK